MSTSTVNTVKSNMQTSTESTVNGNTGVGTMSLSVTTNVKVQTASITTALQTNGSSSVLSSNFTPITNSSCGEAPPISAGSSVVVRNVVTYTCNSGYTLAGSPDNVTCYNGLWMGDPPVCHIQKKSISMINKPEILNNLQTSKQIYLTI